MNSENLMSSVEVLLNDSYPKQEYEGDYITVENTVEGLYGKVNANETTEIKICNKNILCLENKTETKYGITCTVEDDVVTLNGANTGTAFGFYLPIQNVKMNTYYTITATPISGDATTHSSSAEWQCLFKPLGNGNVDIYVYTEKENTVTFYMSEGKAITTPYFWIGWNNEASVVGENGVFDNFKFRIQFEEGENATDFVEHKEQVYNGTSTDFKTYDEVTHIYNIDNINMIAKVRAKGE